MAKTGIKSKKEVLIDQIAASVGAGGDVAVETVDFSDPNRPKTCLEVDFPIIPINQIATIEGNAGKPIYQMSKWWARRRSSVFRSILLAAAMKSPEDESKAAKVVWDAYYGNHQRRGLLSKLKVIDPFMGGGTTIVEGSRLGMRMFGCDLNPIAWFVVKNEVAQVDIEEVDRLLAEIKAEVRSQIIPYYACDGPNGEKGKWFKRRAAKNRKNSPVQLHLAGGKEPQPSQTEEEWEELPESFDIFSVARDERQDYRYEGPEIIYSFWVKHGPCQREGCGHLTPIVSTPIVAIKTLTVSAWIGHKCSFCHKSFDIEQYATRMAPDSPQIVTADEQPFTVMDNHGRFTCPHCGKVKQDEKAFANGHSSALGKAKNKKVELTLLIHPQWLQGCPKHDKNGNDYGGSATDPVEATVRWNNVRASNLRILEVRGTLPEQVTCPETGLTFYTDERGGTVTKSGHFECQASTCGKEQPSAESFAKSGKTAPIANFLIQGYSPRRDTEGVPYGGRYFIAPLDPLVINSAWVEWESRKENDLRDYWPDSEIPFGHMTHQRQPLPDHGYTHWWKFFHPRQLLVHTQLLKAIVQNQRATWDTKLFVLGAFQQYLRNQCVLSFWHIKADKLASALGNPNFHPKTTIVESSVFANLGLGNWQSCAEAIQKAARWARNPTELVSQEALVSLAPNLANQVTSKSVKIETGDELLSVASISCSSATELANTPEESIDLVITDPPFGGLMHYSELSDFFYVWLRLVLRSHYPDYFSSDYSPKALEAVANEARNPENADAFYQRVLTQCWCEAYRVLKPGGILAFTFHHSEDEPWVGVLESLFDAGFYLEATYPIRSDETKGEGEFGSKQIEYDIIHVCRKRTMAPQPISWARLRRLILDDVRRIKNLLTQHQKAGLPAADVQVIKRGKALEYFSRHYGQVYIEHGREFTIREALVGINQLLDDDAGVKGGPEAPPANAEPFTRQFFRLFYKTCEVPRDQIQKFLRGTGIAPSDFEERGWCFEKNKMFILTPPVELARAWKGASRKGMARDFDQTMFLVGGCFEGSNIRVMDTLDSPNFAPHPATVELVDWLTRHGGSKEIKFAAQRAQTIYRDWLGKNKAKAQEQIKLFDLEN